MEKALTVIALDAATQTGYAIYRRGKIETGTKRFPPSRRAGEYGQWLDSLIKQTGAQYVVSEDVYRNKDARLISAFGTLMKLQGVTESVCYNNGCELTLIESYRAKRAIGVPIIKHWKYDNYKRAVRREIEKLGYKVNTDDEADAVAVLLAYLYKHDIYPAHPQ